MIQLTCTQCHETLSIDDAFAGGVCRCQHCGTIQTVPKPEKQSTRPAAPGGPLPASTVPPPKAAKALYRNEARGERPAGSGTGLDELANIVASSGLSSHSLRHRTASESKPPPAATPTAGVLGGLSKNAILIGTAITAVAVIIVVVIWVVMHNTSVHSLANGLAEPDIQANESGAAVAPVVAPKINGPSYAGVALDVPSVIYVIDRGGSMTDVFSNVMASVYRSIASLGDSRRFQIIFWNNSDNREADVAHPATGLAPAGQDAAESAKRALENIAAAGQSEPGSAMKSAEAQNPAVIVLITAKSWDLDEEFEKDVMGAHATHNAKIDTVVIGPDDNPIMKDIAQKTGGRYQRLSAAQVRALNQ